MKENSSSVLLIIILIIIVAVFILFMNRIIAKNKNIETITPITVPTTVSDLDLNYKNNFTITTNNTEINNKSNITDKTKILVNGGESTDPRLIKIVEIFNNTFSKEINAGGDIAYASIIQPNKINVYTYGEGLSYNVEFDLNDDILSTQIYKNGDGVGLLIKSMIGFMVADCVAQMKGYPQRTLSILMTSDKNVTNYTLEKEGIELKAIR